MAKAMKSKKVTKASTSAPQELKQQKSLVQKLRQQIRGMKCAEKKRIVKLKEEIAFLEMCLELYYQLIPASVKQSMMAEAAGAIPDAE